MSKLKRIIELIRSQRMAISKALKSLVEVPLLFIKQEPTTQPLIISFMTALSLTQEPQYILLMIELGSSATLSLY